MSYSAVSFSFGETPSASKFNQLGLNDASFHDGTGIGISVGFYATTTQSSSDGTNFDVSSYTEMVDYGGNFSGGVFTAPYTGFYHFTSSLSYDNTGGGRMDSYLYVNSTEVAHSMSTAAGSALADPGANMSVSIPLTAGDTVKVNVSNNSGGTEAFTHGSHFSGFMVARTSF